MHDVSWWLDIAHYFLEFDPRIDNLLLCQSLLKKGQVVSLIPKKWGCTTITLNRWVIVP